MADKKMNKRERAWLVISVAVPVLGAAAAAHLLAIARGTPLLTPAPGTPTPPFWATEQAGWYLGAMLCALLAVIVAIVAKQKESQKKGALERTNEEQRATACGGGA